MMNSNATRLTVLLLLAVAWTASAQRRGIRTCSCQVGNGLSQQGKLVGRVCYVVGVGSCRSFTNEDPSQQQQFPSQRRFGSPRFPFRSGFQSRFDTNRPSQFNANRQSHFNTNRQSQFNTNRQSQFIANRPSRFDSGRPSRFDIASNVATASPEQHRAAAEQTRRQLESRRTFERELVAAGVTVRPGTPEAALASERRPDSKSVQLGNKALAQILYLQSLLGRSAQR